MTKSQKMVRKRFQVPAALATALGRYFAAKDPPVAPHEGRQDMVMHGLSVIGQNAESHNFVYKQVDSQLGSKEKEYISLMLSQDQINTVTRAQNYLSGSDKRSYVVLQESFYQGLISNNILEFTGERCRINSQYNRGG